MNIIPVLLIHCILIMHFQIIIPYTRQHNSRIKIRLNIPREKTRHDVLLHTIMQINSRLVTYSWLHCYPVPYEVTVHEKDIELVIA